MNKLTKNSIIFLIVTLLGAIGLIGFEIWQYTDVSKPYSAEEIERMEIHPAVNINTATVKELSAISGMNEKLSESVLAYRAEHGGFQEKRELLNVKGIGEETYREIEPYITTE